MRNRWLILLTFIVVVFFMLTGEGLLSAISDINGNDFQIWTANALTKVRPDDPVGTDNTISLSAARNEYESFQIVIKAGATDLSNIDVTALNLKNRDGGLISRKHVRIYKVAYIDIQQRTLGGTTGEWPDALIPKVDDYYHEKRNAFPLTVTAGRNQPIWIEIYVPPDTKPGDYIGRIIISIPGQNKQVVKYSLKVWNFNLPAVASLKTAFTVGTADALAVGHFGTVAVTEDKKLQLMKLYTLAELNHRLSNDYFTYPWPDYDGEQIDWHNFEENWAPFLNGTISSSGARLTSIRLNDFNGNNDDNFYRLYTQYFREKGWFDRLFYYVADEPAPANFPYIKDRSTRLHNIDPELKTLVTTSYQSSLEGSINIWVPVINFMEQKPGFGLPEGNRRAEYSSTISAGNQLWWYQSCASHGCSSVVLNDAEAQAYFTNWPSYMIDLPSIYSRIMEWLSWHYQVSGESYYNTTYAYTEGDAWKDQYYFGGNGDGTLFYPGTPAIIGGTNDIPVESIRLKQIRDGMEDYEYFQILSDLGLTEFVNNQINAVTINTYSWNQDPQTLLNTRSTIATKIDEIHRSFNH